MRLLSRLLADVRGRVGLAIVLVLLMAVIAPELIARADPTEADIAQRLRPPSFAHLFGTDHLGRDLFSRVVFGSRYTLVPTFIVVLASALIGSAVGLAAGYRGGRLDWLLMRASDVALGFPLFIMAMAIIAVIGRGLLNALIAGVIVWWAQYARLMRASVLAVRELLYVEAARAIGLTGPAIALYQILPNAVTPLIVKCTFDIARVLLLLTGLSFLGLGTLPPAPEWGVMITESRSYILEAWWYPAFPGLAIALACLGFNLLGDALATAWNPAANANPSPRKLGQRRGIFRRRHVQPPTAAHEAPLSQPSGRLSERGAGRDHSGPPTSAKT